MHLTVSGKQFSLMYTINNCDMPPETVTKEKQSFAPSTPFSLPPHSIPEISLYYLCLKLLRWTVRGLSQWSLASKWSLFLSATIITNLEIPLLCCRLVWGVTWPSAVPGAQSPICPGLIDGPVYSQNLIAVKNLQRPWDRNMDTLWLLQHCL